MLLPPGKKVYFASDFHLGIPTPAASLLREQRICRWLDSIKGNAAKVYLVGDLFDVWFEYRTVVPKGYVRFLGKLAELMDAGIAVEVFTGNHDLWMRGYFQDELGIPVHHGPLRETINDTRFLIAHGDGLGPGDHGYKLLKGVLRNPVSQWLYRRLHPDTGVGVAGWLSRRGAKHGSGDAPVFLGPEKEWLVQFALDTLQREPIDYFIFGHRHIAIDYLLPQGSHYINLGDWLRYNSYAVFDGTATQLCYYQDTKQ